MPVGMLQVRYTFAAAAPLCVMPVGVNVPPRNQAWALCPMVQSTAAGASRVPAAEDSGLWPYGV